MPSGGGHSIRASAVDTEGAKLWAKVLNDLRNRGVQDIQIAVVEGLKGFPQAIEAAFPQTQIHTCIVHLLRHSMSFASDKNRKAVAAALKAIYTAVDADAAKAAGRPQGQRSGSTLPGNRAELAPGQDRGDPVPGLSTRGPQADLHDERN